MLCQFSVKNFKSICAEVTLDMQAAAVSEHEDTVIRGGDGELYLPAAVIYGPNGGGKSNVLEAFQLLVQKIMQPLFTVYKDAGRKVIFKDISAEPFAFCKEAAEAPTEFELFFSTATAEYRYRLSVKRDTVLYERLDRRKFETGRRSFLFERREGEICLKSALSKLKISDGAADNLPLLSYLGITYGGNEIVKDIIDWFKLKVYIFDYSDPVIELFNGVIDPDKAEDKTLFLNMLKEMDLDIVDFRIEKRQDGAFDIFTKHIIGSEEKELNLRAESSGTVKLFGLLPSVAASLKSGAVLVIDELDAKIHPCLLRYIIELFTHRESNRRGAQLIFTSHDLSTMNGEVFRRDEIWFIAKGREQSSKLYSLVEFKNGKGESVRKDARFDKQYLEGRYGADPYLNRIIDWEDY